MSRQSNDLPSRGAYIPVHELPDWQSAPVSAVAIEEGMAVNVCVLAEVDGEVLIEPKASISHATVAYALCMCIFFTVGVSADLHQLSFTEAVDPASNLLFMGMRNIGSYPACNDTRNELWRLWTSQFVHGGLLHLIGNLIELVIFGKVYEDAAGWLSWVLLVAVAGPVANMAQSLVNPFLVVIGASGVIYALMGACLSRCLRQSPQSHACANAIPDSTKKVICICVFLQVICDVRIYLLQSNITISHISYASHAAGFVCGWVMDAHYLQQRSLFRAIITACAVSSLYLAWTVEEYPPAITDISNQGSWDISALSSCCELRFLSETEAGEDINLEDFSCNEA